MHEVWREGGVSAVLDLLAASDQLASDQLASDQKRDLLGSEAAVAGSANSRSTRPVIEGVPDQERLRRVLVHASGFRQSPYADIKPQGTDAADTRGQAEAATKSDKSAQPAKSGKAPPTKLWHSSQGSSGW